jgi:hypothetical protein
VLKRSQHSLTSIICRSAQRWFTANSERLLTTTRCSAALSRFEVVLSRIPRYLKVYTHSIASPSNKISWHGLVKLNTMTFVFFMFIVNPSSTQNYHSVSNCCGNPTFDSNIRARSSTKSNSHTCKFAKAGASHFLLSKCPSRASKYSPNNKGLKEQPYFTPCWHLKLEVTPSLKWLMDMVSLTYIACKHCKKHAFTPRPANTCHNTSCGILSNAFLKSTK